MATQVASVIAERQLPFHNLTAKIKQIEALAARGIDGREDEIRLLAAEIRGLARAFNPGYERSDFLSQFMTIVTQTFGHPNRIQTYVRVCGYVAKKVREAADMLDLTPAYVDAVLQELSSKGVKADYIRQYL